MSEQIKQLIRELNTNRLCFVPNELRDDFMKTIHERGLIVFGGAMTENGQYAYIE